MVLIGLGRKYGTPAIPHKVVKVVALGPTILCSIDLFGGFQIGYRYLVWCNLDYRSVLLVQVENNVAATTQDLIYTQWNVGDLTIPGTRDMTKAAITEKIREPCIYQNDEDNGKGRA
jgi:hypothetical protein